MVSRTRKIKGGFSGKVEIGRKANGTFEAQQSDTLKGRKAQRQALLIAATSRRSQLLNTQIPE